MNGSSDASPASVVLDAERAKDDAGAGLTPMLIQYWQAALRRRWLIAAVIVAFLAVGAIYTILQPSEFTANTRI